MLLVMGGGDWWWHVVAGVEATVAVTLEPHTVSLECLFLLDSDNALHCSARLVAFMFGQT